ncbi:hypothetical protein QCA50_016989 [Cerrena zonata]|uniref:Uncharacterized protein n=1 Tax=Cerrena zonata TaxID=2478898 RepID=A0AAW0FRA6_9APHY
MASSVQPVSQPPPTWPEPADLFTGRIQVTLAAAVVYRYYRLSHAVWTYYTRCNGDNDIQLLRRRWRIGLHHELIALKRAVGDLLLSGCLGGPFFTWCRFPWLDHNAPDLCIIDWSKIQPLAQCPLQSWMTNSLPREVVTENEWWTIGSPSARPDTVTPPWWNSTDTDIAV